MVDTLRCEEVLSPARHCSTPNRPGNPPPFSGSYHDLIPVFCKAYQDNTIFKDRRVLQNLINLENFYVASFGHYKSLQDEIKPHMRKIVADWMLDVCVDQRCTINVFLLATNILDRFLVNIKLKKSQFQLVGAASIFLASKMIEPNPIPAITLIRCTADTYRKEELLDMELSILIALKWDLTAVTSFNFVDYLIDALLSSNQDLTCPPLLRSSKADKIRQTTEKLITLCATLSEFMELTPSLVSVSALIAALHSDQENSLLEGVNINQVIGRLAAITPVDMGLVQTTMKKICHLFFGNDDSGVSSDAPNSTLEEEQGPSSSLCDETARADSAELAEKELDRQSNNATPTEVFKVVASCIT